MSPTRRQTLGLAAAAALVSPRARAADGLLGSARQSGKVTVGLAGEKPYGFIDSDGKATGAIVEVLRATLKPLGITQVEATVGAFSTLLPGLLARRFDIIGAGMYVNPKRCQQIAFTRPLTRAGGAFASVRGNPKGLRSLNDIAAKGAIIGTQLGTNQVDEIKAAGIDSGKVVLFSTDTEAFAGLQAGRVDVIYFPDLEINTLLTTHGDAGFERVTGFEQIAGPDGAPAFNHQALGLRKEDADFVAAIDAQLAALRDDGGLLKLLQPWGFTENELPEAGLTTDKLCAA